VTFSNITVYLDHRTDLRQDRDATARRAAIRQHPSSAFYPPGYQPADEPA
jgi:hypothetical protein